MKVTIENIKGLNKDLKVLIDKETMNSYMDEKYEEIKKTVNLKGFRPGKVPKDVLKRQFGKAIFGEVLDKLLKNVTIVVGQIVSIIYKTRNLWGDGGIGRRVGLRKFCTPSNIFTNAYNTTIPTCFIQYNIYSVLHKSCNTMQLN